LEVGGRVELGEEQGEVLLVGAVVEEEGFVFVDVLVYLDY
jgi:hypothetical protein